MHSPINHYQSYPEQRQAALRAALIQKHRRLYATVPRSWWTPMKILSISGGLTVLAVGVWLVTSLPRQTPEPFLALVETAYAKENEQASNVNTIHHEKNHLTHPLFGSQYIESWSSGNGSSAAIVSADAGTVLDRSVTRIVDGVEQHYQLHLPPQGVSESFDDSTAICIIQPDPALLCNSGQCAPAALEQADAVSQQQQPTTRSELLKRLLTNPAVIDRGEQDGLHVLELTSDNNSSLTYKYYFDPQSILLKRYVETCSDGSTVVREYLVNEFVGGDINQITAFDTTGLYKILPENDPIAELLKNKPNGCYDTAGNPLTGADFYIENTGNETIVQFSGE